MQSASSFIFFICSALFILSSSICALRAQTTGNETIYLKYADSLIGRTESAGMIRELNGRVNLTQGDVILYCDRAIQYLDLNKVELIGSVRIIQGTVTLTAPRADYDGNQRLAWGHKGVKIVDRQITLDADSGYYSTSTAIANFNGTVKILDDSVKILADSVEYSRRSQNSSAFGRVAVSGRYSNVVLTGDSAWNFPATRYSRIAGNSILRQIDSTFTADSSNFTSDTVTTIKSSHYDTLTISAKVMEAFRNDGELYVAYGTAEIVRASLAARTDTIIYQKRDDILRLRGASPALWYDSTQLRADSISVFIPQKKLRRIEASGNAFSAVRDDTANTERTQQLSGAFIRIDVENDTLRQIFVRGDAKSLYFMQTDGEPDGAARNSADSIRIETLDGKPEIIRWLGGVNGEFFPEIFILKKTSDYYLPNFLWLTDRPKRKIPLIR
ncbi:hypothetical protein MASR2M18_03100 [Ignavibacteria bacterium]|nr:hypothetical protein [Bacteroidota bacterium]